MVWAHCYICMCIIKDLGGKVRQDFFFPYKMLCFYNKNDFKIF